MQQQTRKCVQTGQTTRLLWLREGKLSNRNHCRSFGERIMSSPPKSQHTFDNTLHSAQHCTDQTTRLLWLREGKLSNRNHCRSFGERIMSSHPMQLRYTTYQTKCLPVRGWFIIAVLQAANHAALAKPWSRRTSSWADMVSILAILVKSCCEWLCLWAKISSNDSCGGEWFKYSTYNKSL